MMSTEKMRQDFEKWECDADQGPQTDPVWLMYDANANAYPLDKIQSRWEVWQASRAAIEVELPQVVGYEAGFDSIRENEFASQSGELFDADEVFALSRSIEVREAIESLGLKVKP